jgi:hypothetical protein
VLTLTVVIIGIRVNEFNEIVSEDGIIGAATHVSRESLVTCVSNPRSADRKWPNRLYYASYENIRKLCIYY